MEIVSALRCSLADKVGNERFELWFGKNTRLEWADGTLTIGTPSRFFQQWLQANFRPQIEGACREVLGRCPQLTFRLDADLQQSAAGEPAAASNEADGKPRGPGARPGPCGRAPAEAAATPAEDGARRRRSADLESFVTGRANRLARAAAEMVVERPGEMSPLVVHGPTGVGKTHLLEGIWNAARKSRRLTAVYLTAEQFTTSFLEALRGSGLPIFRQKYRSVDLLIVDDLQFLCGKRCTLVELLHTVDTLLRDGRQLVFAADRPPAELEELGSDLVARLQGGMVCRLDPPDHDTRLGILSRMARQFHLDLPDDVQQFIASRLANHARELSGALCRLQAASQALRQPIGLKMAEQALAEMIHSSNRLVRLPDIEKAVCRTFGLEPASLKSARKSKGVSQPRMLAMWLARKYTRAALAEIGYYFGQRSHSTVISAQKRVDGWLEAGTELELPDRTWSVDDAIRQTEQRLLAG